MKSTPDFSEITEAELFFRISKLNEIKAFEYLFRKQYPALVNFSRKYLRDTDSAEDVVQAVMVDFWENRTSISIQSALTSYLFASVKNRSLNVLKSAFASVHHLEMEEEIESSPANSPQRILEAAELAEKIEKGISLLPEKCQIIFRLSREQELSYAEIAGALDLSVKTVENQMGIALKKLKRIVFGSGGSLFLLYSFQMAVCRIGLTAFLGGQTVWVVLLLQGVDSLK